ncbi:septation protein SepH [Microlunatus ginsengisoli]|uniref:Septation protein SepH n=1 Tax=Microlunatus ginsengisoli TaxID=363863 RepID=A0ABP6ZLT4_9ACTN
MSPDQPASPALTPREIQARIRSGESLADVAELAGIPLDRVERFAAPVIAEREYVAAQALSASVRRRGETSGHRNLRLTITERLTGRGVDVDTLAWDSYRLEDTRWGVTATYTVGEAERQALFWYDVRGRFSVAGNDEARWVLGEQPRDLAPAAAGEDAEDVEPTVDLSDELAIVRAVQEPPPAEQLSSRRRAIEDVVDDVLAGMAEESATAYAGLSDASAVPESASVRGAGWEPAIVVDYPVEPSQVEPADEFGEEMAGTDEPGEPDAPTAVEDREDEADALEEEQAEEGQPKPKRAQEGQAQPEQAEPEPVAATEPEPSTEAPAKRSGRKRASVPSWDEIMFGSPKRP